LRRTWGAAAALLVLGVAACDPGASHARLYVTSGFTDELLELDPSDGQLLARVAVDPRRGETDEPHGIALAPGGGHLYVTVSHGEPTLWKFELPGPRLVGRARLGTAGAGRIGITPDGSRAFVPDYYRAGAGAISEVAVVRLTDLEVTERIRTCAAPHDAAVSPDGNLVALTCSLSDEVVLLDAVTLEEAGRFHVGADPGPPGSPRYRPLNLAWSPCGAALYVTLHGSSEVRAFNTEGEPAGAAAVGAGPAQLAVTEDGLTLVVANRLDGSVSLLDAVAIEERQRVPLGVAHPHGVAISSDQSVAFITYEGTTDAPGGVVALGLEQPAVLWRATAGAYTLGIVHAEVPAPGRP
jgi:DNA-binding beta-propeller fold protein YncE